MFSRDFFYVWLLLLVFALTFSGACTSRKNETEFEAPSVQLSSSDTVNINTADTRALEKVPGIGPSLAKKIVEHRTRYGPFRRIEDLILVEGVSDRRFREIRPLITVD